MRMNRKNVFVVVIRKALLRLSVVIFFSVFFHAFVVQFVEYPTKYVILREHNSARRFEIETSHTIQSLTFNGLPASSDNSQISGSLLTSNASTTDTSSSRLVTLASTINPVSLDPDDGLTRSEPDSDWTMSPPFARIPATTGPSNNSSPTLVVLLSYQRCGSTFLGELFNQNPSVFYQFEPLDSLYSFLSGTPYGWNVPTDINNFGDGSKRVIPRHEIDAVSKFLENVLSCNINALPTDTLVHPYQMDMMSQFRSTALYVLCLQENVTQIVCPQTLLSAICGKRFGEVPQHQLDQCRRFSENPDDPIDSASATIDQIFRQYAACKKSVRRHILSKCIHHLEHACQNPTHRVRAVKVVRANMRSMEPLLRDFSNFRLIHLVRDPRGVALSRARLNRSVRGQWSNSVQGIDPHEMLVREALMYCRTVVEDIRMRRDLERRYPGRILSVVYEDVVADVKEATRRIHEFVGLPLDKGAFLRLNDTVEEKEKQLERSRDNEPTDTRDGGNGWAHFIRSIFQRPRVKRQRTVAIRRSWEIASYWKMVMPAADRARIFKDCSVFFKTVDYNWKP